ncbi:class I SAM-dependent methyltransferase [Blastopirellula marina]|uniref:Methyltransferase domain-containing protein n=1 Tax=Blastopirellula marina DSM 3645 TaxID=314230 RepID=A3ZXJ4_9BACT|nr:class I SAM-dependent methyltransferase [Blastopirellula marina]EAQ78784.1 hypothetical protein DSM3645_29821 [Blastopirellula marina DSM 3645]
MRYLSNREQLVCSDVVANSQMNRQRRMRGANSYERDLKFDLLKYLRLVCQREGRARWLHICCGAGNALVEAADVTAAESLTVEIVGIDLVGRFCANSEASRLQLMKSSVEDFQPTSSFDLITSVHGLHYLGDKLGIIATATSWLTPDGRCVGNLDAKNLQLHGHRTSEAIFRYLRSAGLSYSSRTKLLEYRERRELAPPFEYLGADDSAGPNYTGQAAINSHYAMQSKAAEKST